MIEDAITVLRQNVVSKTWITGFAITEDTLNVSYQDRQGKFTQEVFTEHVPMLEWIEEEEALRNK